MGRAPCCDKASVKKGPWSPEEDAKLKAYIEEHGTGGNWIALPQKIGLKRCGKSCRLRWLNYLRPNIKHGDFTEEEEHIICSLYISIGSRWSIIAAQLPGRTDNDIKNYWNTKLKKKLLGKRAPSRRSRATTHQDPYQLSTAAAAGGDMCSTSSVNNNNNAMATQALSASALERIQLHMRLQQGLYGAFGGAAATPQQWPKLETLLTSKQLQLPATEPVDAVATTVTVQQPPHHHVIDDHHSLAAGREAVEAEQLGSTSTGGGAYSMPCSFERPNKLVGFSSPSSAAATEAEVAASGLTVNGGYGGAGGFGTHHDEIYDFLYKYGSVGAGAHGGHIPASLPELQCPDSAAAIIGADEKFSTWTADASCDYGQLQGNHISGNLHDYALGGYDQ
ncbi:hypothetical protein PR202_ga03183 [Eleusine coracana subsp. coracana]|uniref:Uncharacterized protein n=1 Tax=Eleusine coracana subsp. coracana TaxID=191504 RepID=A0AAV5BMW2_ELECO|nr:hypothetical protein QOZ80_2BG0203730 [Eleusine coracana subsp. coracana]GJM87247.1 hypothetical protein PR202_ga03183 [Eleusine coracana subsp. coracana]